MSVDNAQELRKTSIFNFKFIFHQSILNFNSFLFSCIAKIINKTVWHPRIYCNTRNILLTNDDYNKIKSILSGPTSKIADLKITMTDIKKNWEGMRQDLIKELVKKCITCASRKTLMKSRLM